MQLPDPRGHTSRRISLTPLIDIVFILLLFFILETNFLSLGELGLNLPKTETGSESSQEVLHIQVFPGGRLWQAGRSMDLVTLDGHLDERSYAQDTPVVLSADDSVAVQTLVNVVDILQRHDLSQVQIVPLQE